MDYVTTAVYGPFTSDDEAHCFINGIWDEPYMADVRYVRHVVTPLKDPETRKAAAEYWANRRSLGTAS